MTGCPFLACAMFDNETLNWSYQSATTSENDGGGRLQTDTQNDRLLYRSSPLGTRASCADCGSMLWMKYHCEPRVQAVSMGLWEDESMVGPAPTVGRHIFTQEKAVWFDLPDDGAPRFPAFSPQFAPLMEEWEKAGRPLRKDMK